MPKKDNSQSPQNSNAAATEDNKMARIALKPARVTAKVPITTKPATIMPNEPATETDVSRKSDAAKKTQNEPNAGD